MTCLRLATVRDQPCACCSCTFSLCSTAQCSMLSWPVHMVQSRWQCSEIALDRAIEQCAIEIVYVSCPPHGSCHPPHWPVSTMTPCCCTPRTRSTRNTVVALVAGTVMLMISTSTARSAGAATPTAPHDAQANTGSGSSRTTSPIPYRRDGVMAWNVGPPTPFFWQGNGTGLHGMMVFESARSVRQ